MQCREDLKVDAQSAVISCQKYADCDPKNPGVFALLGQANRVLGRLAAAQSAYERQLTIGQQSNDDSVIGQAYHNLSIVYLEQNAPDRAEAVLKKSLELNIKKDNQAGQAANYKGLADVYFKRGNLSMAESYFKKADDIFEKINDRIGLANTYIGLGYLNINKGQRDVGCSYFRRAQILFENASYPRGINEVENHKRKNRCT